MGIQSTRDISRQDAIDRIEKIINLVKNKNYREIENVSNETDYNVQSFVDKVIIDDNIDNWTNKMLEDVIDCPFFRYSMFDNYNVN